MGAMCTCSGSFLLVQEAAPAPLILSLPQACSFSGQWCLEAIVSVPFQWTELGRLFVVIICVALAALFSLLNLLYLFPRQTAEGVPPPP